MSFVVKLSPASLWAIEEGSSRPVIASVNRTLVRELAVANQTSWLQNGANLPNLSNLQPAAFDTWVQQSHALAQRAYRALTLAPQCDEGSVEASGTMAYVDTFRTPTQQQLGAAAVRLADLLERVLP